MVDQKSKVTVESAEVVLLRPDRLRKTLSYHFVGIGGWGMSGLAQVLHQRGHRVSGSDLQSSEVVEKLGRRGISVDIGHCADWIGPNVDCVVVSAAVGQDNPEWVRARQLDIEVCKYAQMLGRLSRGMKTLSVAGTHGKSTTSGWLAYLLHESGLDPSYVVGADVEQLGGGSGAGKGELMVVEACEYDRSFLNLRSHVAAILNIEADHLDYYRDVDEIAGAFGEFAALTSDDGLLVANADDANVAGALAGWQGRCEYFSLTGKGDWQAGNLSFENGQGCFDLMYRDRKLGRVKLMMAGRHNVANALAVAAMAQSVGATSEQICRGLENFVGVGRRMSYKGKVEGVVIMDDYAHHPTEIQVTLEAIAAQYQPRRLWCVFQPHQHSRTRFFLDEFASSFRNADIILLPDIYFVRESEQLRRDVNARQLVDKINQNGGQSRYLGDFEHILNELCREVRTGDLVVTMGAGDVWKVADELVCRLGRNSQTQCADDGVHLV